VTARERVRAGRGEQWATVRLVARREVVSRLQQRGYRIGALVFIAVIAVVAILPKFIHSSSGSSYDVGVVRTAAGASGVPSADQVAQTLRATGGGTGTDQGQDITVHVRMLDSAAQARADVRDGSLDAAYVPGEAAAGQVLTSDPASKAALLMQSAVRALQVQDALGAAGLSPEQIAAALNPEPTALTDVGSSDASLRKGIATIANVVLFAQLLTFISWVGMGVVEEKTSRVVELVLSAIRPWQLLAGKLIGIGALAIGQLAVAGIVGLAVARASGSVELPTAAYWAVVISFVWFIFGFAFFASLAAAAASLVSRQEEVSGVLMPVSAVLMISYGLGFAAIGSTGTLADVVSVVPPVSALTMPSRAAAGEVPWWQIGLSLGLLVVSAIAVLFVAGRIYRAAVLHAGSRVSLRAAWRGEAVAAVR